MRFRSVFPEDMPLEGGGHEGPNLPVMNILEGKRGAMSSFRRRYKGRSARDPPSDSRRTSLRFGFLSDLTNRRSLSSQ